MRARAAAAMGLVLVMAAGGAAGRPLIAAHRGGALLWPENSLTAFRGALRLGAELVELDVHLTRDGEVVVIHDPTLERTTTGRGVVVDRTWAELAGVTVKGTAGETVPRLAEVLDLIRPSGARLLLELKVGPDRSPYPGIEGKVLRLLEERGLAARTTVMAFDWPTLERLRALSPTLRLTGLLSRRGAEALGGVRAAAERLARLRVDDLGIERTLLTPEAVAAARTAGLTIGVWTVNDPDELRAALQAGVDYVTTDRPDLALELRAKR
ncbi:MAG: glycerophosphodiester phosphodiesterase [Candidatus Rokuibacteriota bacterium]